MQCPKCQFKNPDDAKYCIECSSSMEFCCPKCGAITPITGKFCKECAYDLKKHSKKNHIDLYHLKSYTPKFLVEKILNTQSSIKGERKLVTVIFADVANYTSIAEKLDPEEVHRIMDCCFKILMDEIHNYEGTINQFTGDGVMAIFGAPIAHEDHILRACYASLSIQRALVTYSEKIKREYGIEFKMRMGLNSGPVVVGSIGNDLRLDYTAIGDTTNLAARLESKARPDSILVSEKIYKATQEFFKFVSIGAISVKGKELPQKAYVLIGKSDVKTRIKASMAKGLSRFVGRKNSIKTLKDRWEKVQSGHGQVVGIVGEPGIGKSRLLIEFINQITQDKFTYLEGRCLVYGGSVIYMPIIDVVKSYFAISEEDSEFTINNKITKKTILFDEKQKTVSSPLQDILSQKVNNESYLKLESIQKKQRVFDGLRDIFIRESLSKPLILAIEDLHWIDKASEDFLDYFIGWLATVKIFIILLYRPEYTHTWESKSFYTRVGLTQLGNSSSSKLVQAILNEGKVSTGLRDLILKRASGNPLFIEELTNSLLDKGSIHQKNRQFIIKSNLEDSHIPETIQGIIASRIDRLDENLKKTLQLASVIGREFSYRILQNITNSQEELKSCLLNLQGLEFIYKKHLFPELEYIFKHALIQEVAYNSLLQKKRKNTHERIGRAIETICGERKQEFYEILAYHYSKSDNHKKASAYSRYASKKVEKAGSLNNAVQYIEKGIESLEKLPKTNDTMKSLVQYRITLGLYLYQLFSFIPAMRAIEPIIEETLKHNNKKYKARIFTIIGAYKIFIEENISEAYNNLEKALKFAKEVNDVASYFFACQCMAQTASYNCDFDKAKKYFNKALEINKNRQSIWGTSTFNSALSFFVYGNQGKIDISYQVSGKALKLAEESGDIYSMTGALIAHGVSCFLMGYLEDSEKYLLMAINYSKKLGPFLYNSYIYYYLALISFESESYQKTKKYFLAAIKFSQTSRTTPSFLNLLISGFTLTKVMGGEKEINLQAMSSMINSNKLKIYDGILKRNYAEMLFYVDNKNFSDSMNSLRSALKEDEVNKTIFNLGMDYLACYKLHKNRGDYENGKSNLLNAIETFKECGAIGWVKKYIGDLNDL